MVAESPHGCSVSPAQAARLLGVSRMTIYRWIESGRLIPLTGWLKNRIPREQIANIRLGQQ